MSIVSLATDVPSSINLEHVHKLAAGLGFCIADETDAAHYLLLLRSLEGVIQKINDEPDYIDPSLLPQPAVGPRTYWKPSQTSNPFNAWSHQCDIRSASPTSDTLKGRTIAIKDNISVGGLPTTVGSFPEIWSGEGGFPVSPIDATVVSRILAAGATIKGTSTCENYCASPLSFTSATGPVHHPLLHGYTTGGSSSGSCALVTSNVLKGQSNKSFGDTVELAIGGDQAGSVRNPACYTGVYGLKPTFGLIPYTEVGSMSPMIDHLEPIASNLEDIAVLLSVMAGWDGLDPRMTPESPLVGQVKDYPTILSDFRTGISAETTEHQIPLRVGFLTESFAVKGVSADVRDAILLNGRSFFEAAGAEVVDISVPMHSDGPVIWTASTRLTMSDSLCRGRSTGFLSFMPPHLKPRWPPGQETYDLLNPTNPAVINIMLSTEYSRLHCDSAVEAKAQRKVFELRSAYDSAFDEVDVLVTPCAPTVAMPHPQMEGSTVLDKLSVLVGLTNNTCPFNVTGHPAMSVPCGSSTVSKQPDVQLPIGMQIVGRRWEDETVLKAAALLELGKRLKGKQVDG